MPKSSTATHVTDEKDAHSALGDRYDDHKEAKHKKKGHGHYDKSDGKSSDVSYYRFSREFVVPIMRDDRISSLVILNLNLEFNSSASQELFSLEPKLRDNIMTTLIKLSSDGSTLDAVTDTGNYETIRSTILRNLQSAISSDIRNVLILDMAKQDL